MTRWITNAPIVERSREQFSQDMGDLLSDAQEFEKPTEAPEDTIWARNSANRKTLLESQKPTQGARYFTYLLSGRPVGVMELSGSEVDLLATHPGLSGCGAAMLERALAEQRGTRPTLTLMPVPAAVEAYRRLGFTGGEFEMTLDPAAAGGRWVFQNGRWRYAGNDPNNVNLQYRA